MLRDWEVVEVAADRFEKIGKSYSGDTIGDSKTIRRPFKFQGKLFVATGGMSGGNTIPYEECYQIVPREQFNGRVAWYGEKLKGGDWAAERRAQPNGFYHGMLIKRGDSEWVLVGPPLIFQQVQGSITAKQLTLL